MNIRLKNIRSTSLLLRCIPLTCALCHRFHAVLNLLGLGGIYIISPHLLASLSSRTIFSARSFFWPLVITRFCQNVSNFGSFSFSLRKINTISSHSFVAGSIRCTYLFRTRGTGSSSTRRSFRMTWASLVSRRSNAYERSSTDMHFLFCCVFKSYGHAMLNFLVTKSERIFESVKMDYKGVLNLILSVYLTWFGFWKH